MEKLLDEQNMIYRDIFSYIEYTEELDLPKLDFAIVHREGLPELLREKRPT